MQLHVGETLHGLGRRRGEESCRKRYSGILKQMKIDRQQLNCEHTAAKTWGGKQFRFGRSTASVSSTYFTPGSTWLVRLFAIKKTIAGRRVSPCCARIMLVKLEFGR